MKLYPFYILIFDFLSNLKVGLEILHVVVKVSKKGFYATKLNEVTILMCKPPRVADRGANPIFLRLSHKLFSLIHLKGHNNQAILSGIC